MASEEARLLAEEIQTRLDDIGFSLAGNGDDYDPALNLIAFVLRPILAERDAALKRAEVAEAERARLEHLHKLDHALADQWEARLREVEQGGGHCNRCGVEWKLMRDFLQHQCPPAERRIYALEARLREAREIIAEAQRVALMRPHDGGQLGEDLEGLLLSARKWLDDDDE